jgi:hypothetical protein
LKLDKVPVIKPVFEAMRGCPLTKVRMRSFSVVLLFAFCQIIGAMCGIPDLSLADDRGQLAEDMSDMACPMDGTIMCPPSAVSSPERQLKQSGAIELNPVQALPDTVVALNTSPTPVLWSWSFDSELVPISIASSSVLRI